MSLLFCMKLLHRWISLGAGYSSVRIYVFVCAFKATLMDVSGLPEGHDFTSFFGVKYLVPFIMTFDPHFDLIVCHIIRQFDCWDAYFKVIFFNH